MEPMDEEIAFAAQGSAAHPDRKAVTSTAAAAAAAAAAANKADPSRIRRRNRMITSCLECRRRKLKCDKLHPCTNCTKFARDCIFLAPALDTASQMKLTEIKEKMGSLERVLEQDVARSKAHPKKRSLASKKSANPLPGQEESDESDDTPVPKDEKNIEPNPLAIQDAAYEDDADDDLVDLGFKFGRMRITERIGGFFRPKMAEELTITLNDWQRDHRTPEDRVQESLSPQRDSLSPPASFLEPGPHFIPPRAGFFFGGHDRSPSLIDYLPSRQAADRLLRQYEEDVNPIARVLHWPSLQVSYDNFWTNISMGIEPVASLQALIFAIMFSAAVSMPDDICVATFGITNSALVENFQQATEVALSKANFLRTTKVETLQALVIYIIPMCRDELSRAHSALVSSAIRLAECMGLHRDPTRYGLSPVEVHVRRLLWYQLCFLDIRTCEVHGPRPTLRRDEFDTQMPLNIDDADLVSTGDPKEQDRFTDMTLMRVRFETNEMLRVLWNDRLRLERKGITLTHILGKVEAFRKAFNERYMPMLDDAVPIQRLTKILMRLFMTRMHVMLLHRYHSTMGDETPDRLRQLLLGSGTEGLECAVELETAPDLSNWAWYTGAYQQYHTAILLLMEVYAFPNRKEGDRIWRCLDYIFDADPHQPRHLKGRQLLSEMRDKFGVYRDMRKMRAPVTLAKHVEEGVHPLKLKQEMSSSPSSSVMPLTPRSKSKSNTPSSHIPLNFDMVNWQPIRPSSVEPQPPQRTPSNQSVPSSSKSPKSPSSAKPSQQRTTNWSFSTPSTYIPPKKKTGKSGSEKPDPRRPAEGSARPQPPLQPLQHPQQPQSQGHHYTNVAAAPPPPPPPPQGSMHPGYPAPGTNPFGNAQSQMFAAANMGPGGPGMPHTYGLQQPSPALVSQFSQEHNYFVGPPHPGTGSIDEMMNDIDWHEWDKLFPPSINTGELDRQSPYTSPQHQHSGMNRSSST